MCYTGVVDIKVHTRKRVYQWDQDSPGQAHQQHALDFVEPLSAPRLPHGVSVHILQHSGPHGACSIGHAYWRQAATLCTTGHCALCSQRQQSLCVVYTGVEKCHVFHVDSILHSRVRGSHVYGMQTSANNCFSWPDAMIEGEGMTVLTCLATTAPHK